MLNIGNDWDKILAAETEKEYYIKLKKFLISEYKNHKIYPPKEKMLNAFWYTPYSHVKAVILGQDPYHEEGQAEGLAFSVPEGVTKPPSLLNIFKELENDLRIPVGNSGSLKSWAENGVLLLNTCLTVREHEANSHKNKGWEIFTDKVISILDKREEPIVFILWGRNAREKKKFIKGGQHLILEGTHPSPLSANRGGFFGGRYFSKTNMFLRNNDVKEIDWKYEKNNI